MKTLMGVMLTGALAGLFLPSAHALEVVDNGKLRLEVHGRGQMFGVAEVLPDPVRDNMRIYLFMKQARLGFKGHYEDVKFETQMAFGGENANGSNTDLGLLDFVADLKVPVLGGDTTLKIGQFRVPYGREGITDRGYMNFGERSVANMATFQGRDYGLALQRSSGKFVGTVGVFSAGGRDVPQRYLPERLGVPETVVRIGYNDGVDEDIYHVVGTDLNATRTTKAAYLNALYMQDTLIGHSTVLNVKTIDKNLLINSNFNQFIKAGPNNTNGNSATLQRGNLWSVGGDAVVRHPLGKGRALEGEAQIDWAGFQNRYGVLHVTAGRVQGSYRFDPYQIGVRYAVLVMDSKARYRSGSTSFDPNLGAAIHEITPSVTWHHRGHNVKLVADAPITVNMPLWYEPGVGAYSFSRQPDQVTNLSKAGANTGRRLVVEGRMLFQFLF